MKITWLTQAGLLFDNDRIRIMVDPYLSDSVGKRSPEKHRRIPVDERFFDIDPDVIIITHDHLDHLDPRPSRCSSPAPRRASPSSLPRTLI